jgi:hypothetical protein
MEILLLVAGILDGDGCGSPTSARRWSSAGYSVSERVAAHALRFLRHRTKRQASLLVIRTERGQRVQVEGRAKIHMLYDCRIVGLRRRTSARSLSPRDARLSHIGRWLGYR